MPHNPDRLENDVKHYEDLHGKLATASAVQAGREGFANLYGNVAVCRYAASTMLELVERLGIQPEDDLRQELAPFASVWAVLIQVAEREFHRGMSMRGHVSNSEH